MAIHSRGARQSTQSGQCYHDAGGDRNGGAGFRYMFAAFLEESAGILSDERLLRLSGQMTATGDKWRSFGVQAARHCKGRSREGEGFASYAAVLRECADEEESIFRELKKIVPKIPSAKAM